jgi:YVTN family beta-propeller protein
MLISARTCHASRLSITFANSHTITTEEARMPQSLIIPCALLFVFTLSSFSSLPSRKESAARGLLLVANKGDRSLGIIDTVSGQQLAAVAEGGTTGHEVIASPDGRFAYVPIYGNSGVGKPGTDGNHLVVIDIAARKVVGHVAFDQGVRPHCPLIGPRDGLLYVTTEITNTVTVIDPRTLKVVATIPTNQAESHMLAITRDGRRGYTANVGPGTVSVLDLATRKTVAVIAVAPVVQRIALSTDDRLAFTSDQTQPRLAVIDTATNTVKTWVRLPATGYGAAATPDGRWLIIALPAANKVAAIDLKTMTVAHTIDVPAAPQEVVVRPDGGAAYVSCDASGKVAALNLSAWKVEKLIDAGKGADGLAWAAMK